MGSLDITGRRYDDRDELFRDLQRMRRDGWRVQHMDVVPTRPLAQEEAYPEYSFYVSFQRRGKARGEGWSSAPGDPIVAFYNVAERWSAN